MNTYSREGDGNRAPLTRYRRQFSKLASRTDFTICVCLKQVGGPRTPVCAPPNSVVYVGELGIHRVLAHRRAVVIDEVINNQQDLVEIVETLKQLVCVKG